MREMTWVVKVTKFCNLRCAYCYEWNHLAETARMSIETWRKLFIGIRDYHYGLREKTDQQVRTLVCWHGGEPLAVPASYFREVQAVRDEIIGSDDTDIVNAVQTNLYALSDEMAGMLRDFRFQVSTSYDHVPGVRRSLTGATTERRVLENIEKLRRYGISPGVICVAAKHTIPQLNAIYDYLATRRLPLRVLPLFSGPETRDHEVFDVPYSSIVEALQRLFVHWVETGAAIDVVPFYQWLSTVVRYMLGIETELYDRRKNGESVLIVGPDGAVYPTRADGHDRDVATPLGNLSTQTIHEILSSPAYASSLRSDESLLESTCASCEFFRRCNSYHVLAGYFPISPGGRCSIEYEMHRFIHRYLVDSGFALQELQSMLRSELAVEHTNRRAAG